MNESILSAPPGDDLKTLPDPTSPSKARLATAAAFFVNGGIMATWVSRIPALKDKLGLNDAQLGVALFGIAVGALCSFSLAGYGVPRFGSRLVTVVAGFFLCLALVGIAVAASMWELALALLFLGAGSGAMDVAMNAQGVEVEKRIGRPIMSSLHGTFSLGGLGGAVLGGLVTGRGVAPLPHFALVSVLAVWLLSVSAIYLLRPNFGARLEAAPAVFAMPSRKLLGFGAIAFCAFLTEGAMADWSAVYLRDTLGTSASYAAVGFAAFSLTMTMARFGGDVLVARLGATRIVVGGGLLAAVGLAGSLVSGEPGVALLGFACVGAGMASVAPVVFSAAGQAAGMASGTGIAAVATMGYAGFLAGPASIGFLAHSTSLRVALGVVVLPGLLIAALGNRVFRVNET